AAVAGGDVLGILQGPTGDVAQGADGFAAVLRAPGLAAIFDEDQVVLVGDGAQFRHPAGIAREVYRDDRLGFRRDSPTHIGGIQGKFRGEQVREDRYALLIDHANDGADVGDGRSDN